jgi:LPS sulfotransferase NodH
MGRFVILAAPRTGSNLLCTMLDSHPRVLCHHEIFNPRFVRYALTLREGDFDLGPLEERDRDPLAYLERVWRSPGSHDLVGFKMTRGQEGDVMDAVLDDPGVKKITLRRENRIRTYVSEQIAERLDQWEVYDERDLAGPRPRIEVDCGDLARHVSLNEGFYAMISSRLQRSRQDGLEVHYERLFDSGEQHRILDYLGVEAASGLVAHSVRQNSEHLSDLIANYDQLRDALAGSDLALDLSA